MKCGSCPVRESLACLGEQHRPVCVDVANGLPGRAEQLIALAENPPAPARRPGRLAMARSFLVALARHVWDPRKAPRSVRAARMASCRACPHFEPSGPSCRACGCGSVIKGGLELKLSWATSRCPLPEPRWGPA